MSCARCIFLERSFPQGRALPRIRLRARVSTTKAALTTGSVCAIPSGGSGRRRVARSPRRSSALASPARARYGAITRPICVSTVFPRGTSHTHRARAPRDLPPAHHDRYASVLDAVLSGGVVSEQHRLQLAQFRQIHRVSDEEHTEQLRLLGWTAEQYKAGKNAATAPPPTDARHHAQPTSTRAVARGGGEASVDVDAAQIGQVGRGWQSKLGWRNGRALSRHPTGE